MDGRRDMHVGVYVLVHSGMASSECANVLRAVEGGCGGWLGLVFTRCGALEVIFHYERTHSS